MSTSPISRSSPTTPPSNSKEYSERIKRPLEERKLFTETHTQNGDKFWKKRTVIAESSDAEYQEGRFSRIPDFILRCSPSPRAPSRGAESHCLSPNIQDSF